MTSADSRPAAAARTGRPPAQTRPAGCARGRCAGPPPRPARRAWRRARAAAPRASAVGRAPGDRRRARAPAAPRRARGRAATAARPPCPATAGADHALACWEARAHAHTKEPCFAQRVYFRHAGQPVFTICWWCCPGARILARFLSSFSRTLYHAHETAQLHGGPERGGTCAGAHRPACRHGGSSASAGAVGGTRGGAPPGGGTGTKRTWRPARQAVSATTWGCARCPTQRFGRHRRVPQLRASQARHSSHAVLPQRPAGLCASHSGRGAAAATTSRQAPLPGIFRARALMCRLQARAGRARRSPRLPRPLHGCAAPRHNRRRGKCARLRRRYEPHACVLLHPLRAAAAAAGRGPPPGLPLERHIAGAARLPSSRACRERCARREAAWVLRGVSLAARAPRVARLASPRRAGGGHARRSRRARAGARCLARRRRARYPGGLAAARAARRSARQARLQRDRLWRRSRWHRSRRQRCDPPDGAGVGCTAGLSCRGRRRQAGA